MPTKILMPRLKHASWIEDNKGRTVWRPLSPEITESPGVVFGYDQPHTVEYLRPEALLKDGKTRDELEQEAISNLVQRPANWQTLELPTRNGQVLTMLVHDSDFYAAEQILNKDFLREAADILKAEQLAVGIPQTRALLVTNLYQNMDDLAVFINVVRDLYAKTSDLPISPLVIAMRDGEIVGHVRFGGETPEPPVEREASAARISQFTITHKDTGLEIPLIMASAPSVEELNLPVWATISQTITMNLPKQNFSGRIYVVITPNMPYDEPLKTVIAELEAQFVGVMSEMNFTTVSGRKLQLTVSYDQPATIES